MSEAKDIDQKRTKTHLIMDDKGNEFAKVLFKKITEHKQKQTQDVSGVYIIEFNHIKNLHLKMTQLCRSLNFSEGACNVTIYFKDDTKSEFNSFELFEKSYTDRPNETLQIIYQYNMAKDPIFDSQGNLIQKMEPYVITVVFRNIRSISENEQIPLFLINRTNLSPIHMEVEFVDYPIATTLISNLNEWVKTVNHQDENSFLVFLQKHNTYFEQLCKCFFLIVPIIVFLFFFKNTIPSDYLFKSLLGAFCLLIIFMEIGKIIGSRLEFLTDSIQDSSRILLTTGDNIK